MIRSIAVFTVFAISLLAVPTNNSVPLPTCNPNCPSSDDGTLAVR